ncbi:nucleotidyltransferase family protein [Ekhidna sp.]
MSRLSNIGLVLLAAGESKRLGQPKQLVKYQGISLLQRAIDTAEEVNLQSRVLIVGGYSDEVLSETNCKSFHVEKNEAWRDGMAGSLVLGLQTTIKLNPQIDGVLVMVSDQPFINTELLNRLIDQYAEKSDIVASEYEGIAGVPVLLGEEYFDEIKELDGDYGARKIVKKHSEKVKTIKFDQGNFDIDTPQDLERLNGIKN